MFLSEKKSEKIMNFTTVKVLIDCLPVKHHLLLRLLLRTQLFLMHKMLTLVSYIEKSHDVLVFIV